jgi:hypothetical protein
MIELSGDYGSIPSINCHKVSRILQVAANRLNELRESEEKYAHALKRVVYCDKCMEMAREALK